jgi:plastocyanin
MRTRMNRPALLISLLALGALGLVACGDDDGSDESAAATPATTTATARAAGTGGDHRVDLFTPHAELVFCRGRESECAASEPATAEAGELTIVWENGGGDAGLHNICMADEQGKPVFNHVVFNGGRERTAARESAPGGLESTPRCSQTTKGRTIRARAKVKPGEYTYYCSVGRHREAGMEGTLTVK